MLKFRFSSRVITTFIVSTSLLGCSSPDIGSRTSSDGDPCAEAAFDYENVSKWLEDGSNIPARKIVVCQIALQLKKGEAKIEEIALGYAQKAATAWLSSVPLGAFAMAMGGGNGKSNGTVLSKASLDAIDRIVRDAFERDKQQEFADKLEFYKKSYFDYLASGENELYKATSLMNLAETGNMLLTSSVLNGEGPGQQGAYKTAKVYQLIASQALAVYRDIDKNDPGSRKAQLNARVFVEDLNKRYESLVTENYSKVSRWVITEGGGRGGIFEGRSCRVRYAVKSFWTNKEWDYTTITGVTNCALNPVQEREYEVFYNRIVAEEFQREFLKYFGTRYNDIMLSWTQVAGVSFPTSQCQNQYSAPAPCPVVFSGNWAWQPLPGLASEIGVYNESNVSVLGLGGANREIYKWWQTDWALVPGFASALDVGPDGSIWAVNAAGEIYRDSGGGFVRLPGSASDIGVGADGSAWVISLSANDIYRWNGSDWFQVPGKAKRVSVGPDGNAVVLSPEGRIYRYNGTGFVEMPGRATDVGVGADGSIWIIGVEPNQFGFDVLYWAGSYWVRVEGGGVAVDVDNKGQPWVVNNSGNIFSAVRR